MTPNDRSAEGVRARARSAKKRGVRYIYVEPEFILALLGIYDAATKLRPATQGSPQ